jgi:hypothetical protein
MSVTLRVLTVSGFCAALLSTLFATRSLADRTVWGATDGGFSTNPLSDRRLDTTVSPAISSRGVFTLGSLLRAGPSRYDDINNKSFSDLALEDGWKPNPMSTLVHSPEDFWHRHDPDFSDGGNLSISHPAAQWLRLFLSTYTPLVPIFDPGHDWAA